MQDRPGGTVTFLFTDIEGSTARWESNAESMRTALAEHDEVLRAAIESRNGWVFKHTGDGVCAAFATPGAAVDAAIGAQHELGLPVRMGIATGEAEPRGDDYFGPVLNRVARVMAAGHGGQILMAESTSALVDDVDVLDLGERRLRDLSGPQHLFQVVAPGLAFEFAPLRTLDSIPGNLPVQATSFVGRDREVAEVAESVREHRLVTLSGVGGVGKTRLALQVAAELAAEFTDGVWLVELAEVGDPAAVPDAVAAALGLRPQPGMSITESVTQSLADRRALMVFDNCEHVLDAAADLLESVLSASSVVKVLATSREGTRLPGEHVWSVPSLEVGAGLGSEAVGLFADRALAVDAGFTLSGEADVTAVLEICERLDGIALAIELAAARMGSMTPSEVRDRLGDRFRLLAGGRRGLERHQTLRHAVQWSYELLDDDERLVLNRCAVFAGGFDLPAAIEVAGAGDIDEYQTLDLLDSLVRKSLLTVGREQAHTRYAMLETIRQFAEEQLAAVSAGSTVRDHHARYLASGAEVNMERWASSDQRGAYEWYESELSNLRAAFRWAADSGDIDSAATIAGKVAYLAAYYHSFEPAGWCVELLDASDIGEHRLLRWLYMGASQRGFLDRPDEAVRYSETGLALPTDGFEDVAHELERVSLGIAMMFAGDPGGWLAIAREISTSPNDDLALGPISVVWMLPMLGDFDEATSLAAEMLQRAKATESPFSISYAHAAYGRAFAKVDPERALEALRTAIQIAHVSRNRMFEAVFKRELAGLEATDGNVQVALDSLDHVIDAFHQLGDTANLAPTLGYLVLLFHRLDRHVEAATLYGAIRQHPASAMVAELGHTEIELRKILGPGPYDECVTSGADRNTRQIVSYAQTEIQVALDALPDAE